MLHRFRLSLASLLLGLLLIPVATLARDITPSDRVTSRVNVRAGASTDQPIVGKLQPGETAELLESFPRWDKVRLENGVEGFVSKAWTVEVAPSPVSNAIRIGTWNMKKLGHGSTKDFALLTVIEVMQKQGGHAGYDTLLARLGSAWAGMVTESPRPRTGSGNAEFYAVLYRPNRVEPCAGWHGLRYQLDNDGSPTGVGEDHFAREPAYGCFVVRSSSGGVGCDFMVAAYHAAWADGNEDEIVAEVSHLPELFQSMADAVPGEKDLMVIGDFNLVPESLSEAVSAADRTTGTGSTLRIQGTRTHNLYDHLLVRDEAATTELKGNAEVIDVVSEASSPKTFYKTLSDHLPIVATMACGGPDDD